ncbi:MAG: hypothetical protein L6R40_002342 [Gallowayella cf. fulva]|nr:MAG: hypothetical protein L6R40_002342 [Xanthomendoza cf. fulva]
MTNTVASNQDLSEIHTGMGFLGGSKEGSINVAQNDNGTPTTNEATVSTPMHPNILHGLEELPKFHLSHESRVRLVSSLQEQIRRLNDELMTRQDGSENTLALTEQDVIAQALSEDSQMVESDPMAYQSKMETRVMVLKKMKLEDWTRERIKATEASITSSSRVGSMQPPADNAINNQRMPGERDGSLRLGGKTSSGHDPANSSKNNWTCEICNTRISTQRDLLRHKETRHRISDSGGPIHEYLCAVDGCPSMVKAFNRRDLFRNHIMRMHPKQDVEDVLKRSVRRVHSTHVSQARGPSTISVVLFSEDGELYIDKCAKVDEVMSISIVSRPVLLRLKVSYVTCDKLEVKDANGETHRPFGKVLLQWHKVDVSKTYSETFYVVDASTTFATFRRSVLSG